MDLVDTVVDRIGEIMQPILSGTISRDPMRGDLYDLVAAGGSSRRSDDQVTLFKNGGGAHLDLMIASYAVEALKSLKIKYRSRHLPDRSGCPPWAAGSCPAAHRITMQSALMARGQGSTPPRSLYVDSLGRAPDARYGKLATGAPSSARSTVMPRPGPVGAAPRPLRLRG
ncbi:hypothetical protein [Paracoccus sp. pheM1]|uniref:hypothetical protein n=1 Tax=Paracoccus sp. pheM1 TaxID=2831675 RepID=UPI001BDB863E|nr:hypothetical protein [Paracoccus sp. pheM1]MBT0782316.1 hypothetical protein [Paracoccus sp. pheM1]